MTIKLRRAARGMFLTESERHQYGVAGERGNWVVACWPLDDEGNPDGPTEAIASTQTLDIAKETILFHIERNAA